MARRYYIDRLLNGSTVHLAELVEGILMSGYGPTIVGSYDYYLVAVSVSVPEAPKLLPALECFCVEVVK
jgi:hypothetical protein